MRVTRGAAFAAAGAGANAAGSCQCFAKFCRHPFDRVVAILRAPLECVRDDRIEMHKGRDAERRRIILQHGVEPVDVGGGVERDPSRHHFEQQHAKREDVGASVDGVARDLFGRHVAHRARDRAWRCHQCGCQRIRPIGLPGKAEVQQLHTALRQEDIGRFEIAVHESLLMERRDDVHQRRHDSDRIVKRHGAAAQPVRKRLAVDTPSRETGGPHVRPLRQQLTRVWMRQRRAGASFT